MKITLKYIITSTALGLCLFLRPTYADTIASWTFENSYQTNAVTGTDSAGLIPESGPEGSLAWGHHESIASTYNDVTGNSSAHALTANHWAIGDYYEFQTATLGFTSISIAFDQYRSGTGPTDWSLQYSMNGADFTVSTNGSYSLDTSSSWHSLSFDLASVTALEDQANVYFRVRADSAPSSTAGAVRIDNFAVLGEVVPEPSGFILAGLGGLFSLLRRRKIAKESQPASVRHIKLAMPCPIGRMAARERK